MEKHWIRRPEAVIHFFDRSLTIITPAKCGSSSLHVALCTAEIGGMFAVGHKDLNKHTNELPYEATLDGWQVAVLVRNPYDRAASLYRHSVEEGDSYLTFDQFIESVLLPREDPFSHPISEKYSGYSRYWKIEHIDDCLSDFGFSVSVPVINKSKIKAVVTEKHAQMLRDWANPDCEAFNYELR